MRTFLISLFALAAITTSLFAQGETPAKTTVEDQVKELEPRVKELGAQVTKLSKDKADHDQYLSWAVYLGMAAAGGFLLLTAVFCSVWAQDHGRSGLLWFLIGLIFNVLALIIVLVLNPNKKNYSPGS